MIRVGFFREMEQGESSDPSLAMAVRPSAHPQATAILSYLHAAPIVEASFGRSRDVLDPGHAGLDTLCVHSDGRYRWPGDLAHYVERYNVALPDDFVAHMRARGFAAPARESLTL